MAMSKTVKIMVFFKKVDLSIFNGLTSLEQFN